VVIHWHQSWVLFCLSVSLTWSLLFREFLKVLRQII